MGRRPVSVEPQKNRAAWFLLYQGLANRAKAVLRQGEQTRPQGIRVVRPHVWRLGVILRKHEG